MGKEVATILGACVLAMAAACRPEPPPTVPPVPSVPPSPPPLPPVLSAALTSKAPACETVEDKCVAASGTRVNFGQYGTSFRPPTGWVYAKEPAQTLTMPAEGGAVVAFGDGAGETPELLWQAFQRMFERLRVTGVERKAIRWTKPGASWRTDAVELKVWEVEKQGADGRDPAMNGEAGSLLLAVSRIDDRVVVGLAFLSRRAPSELVGPIRDSIESLEKR